jgi:hypothetical protein
MWLRDRGEKIFDLSPFTPYQLERDEPDPTKLDNMVKWIKWYREKTRVGLKEAKDVHDVFRSSRSITILRAGEVIPPPGAASAPPPPVIASSTPEGTSERVW